jgi:cysteinyl-tRNA synthetase
MSLKLYNTLTRKKEEFTPYNKDNVRMYVCGPTVYDRPHIGNARSAVVYDVLYRLLKHLYGDLKVTYVRNITDVDDKINAAAKQNGEPISALTKRVEGWFHDDMAALGVLPASRAITGRESAAEVKGHMGEPHATHHIPHMIDLIEKLIAHKHAYVSEGHVLFSVTSDKNYGQLSGRKLDELVAGARVEVESYKRHPGDFVLWKPAENGDDPSSVFDSPWGKGRPGWHIECSAMSTAYLGENFDIHGGGADLMFPHHENEIAQSRCALPGSTFARYWVHNGFLTVNGEKMSKSLGNFITVRDLIGSKSGNEEKEIGRIIRYALLSAKYNEPLDWSQKLFADAEKAITRFDTAFKSIKDEKIEDDSIIEPSKELIAALADDLNCPHALNHLHELATKANSAPSTAARIKLIAQLARDLDFLGFFVIKTEPSSFIKIGEKPVTESKWSNLSSPSSKLEPPSFKWTIASAASTAISTSGSAFGITTASLSEIRSIEDQINARAAAKKAKNWAEADKIRKTLADQGIILEDRPDGTTDWRKA